MSDRTVTLSRHEVVVDRDWLESISDCLRDEFPELVEEIKKVAAPKEPDEIRTEDGYTLVRQSDGSYTDGDLTFESLKDIDATGIDYEEVR
jgi:hypothetical protein